ncbi:phage tail tape measure protein [Mongoliibacter ruber]|uniref:TP901 family phage tail tape measure protein n=1 Tax=Mongoliibacter ruber TaxID=1750599 RepID=A0A2T0WV33_9BACT|nr:phage tail tape measure protein [Mongoliibacter ruber]PRY90548.1 TP901 family phage tail tape measure protein [Mongoliibacter ruber]
MSKLKEDKSRVRLEVDGKQAINELGKLEMESKELVSDMKAAKKGTDDYINANKRLNEVKKRITDVRKELGLAGMTMGQLTRYQRDLRTELTNTTTRGTQRYRELNAEIQKVNVAIRQQRAELNGTAGFFNKMGKELRTFGLLAIGYLGAGAFMGQVQSMVQGSAKLSDELSDVQKTTGLTDQELTKLNNTLRNMDTRTARSELRGLAEIAGRLGLQSIKDIEGFVNAADKINVSLGDQLGDPEKVMRQLGKLTSTFGVTKEFGIEQALLKVGSAINELGMASTANEGYLVEFTKRMGGIAPLAKISIENVLGLGATLDSLGQTSEVSSTALSKLFIGMAKNADQYAKYAKMEVKDFVDLLNTDANEAFIRMLEGVKDNSAGITDLASTLGDLKQDGGRVVGVLGTLANNTETLRKQQEIANAAFREGTSVVNEYNLKNENMAANLAKIQKWMAGLFVNSEVMNGLNEFVGAWARWIKIPISQKIQEERIELNKMYLQIISTNTGTEDRIKLIKNLQEKYPAYLGNLNAEKVSNKKLGEAIKLVNDQLVNKIILQEQDEKIQSAAENTARARMNMLKAEDHLREEMLKVAEKFNLKIFEGLSLEDQAQTLFARAQSYDNLREGRDGKLLGTTAKLSNLLAEYRTNIEINNKLDEDSNMLITERERLIERLGITMDAATGSGGDFDIPDDPVETTTSDGLPSVEKTKDKMEQLRKLWEKYKENIESKKREFELSQMEGEEREIAKVKDQYAALELELASHFDNKVISEQEFINRLKELAEMRNLEIGEIDKKHREQEAQEKLDAEKKIREATMEERALAELKIKEHYDILLELARKFGIDQQGIIAERQKALGQLADKYRQKEIQDEAEKYEAKKLMAMDFASVATGTMGLVANFSGDIAKYDKTMAIAKAAIGSAEAIANMIKMFSATSFTPIDLAAKIAAGTGIILGNINAAMRVANRTSIPDAPETPDVQSVPTRGRRGTTAVKSYWAGGGTDNAGMGFGDKFGEFAGFVHKHEYVVPEILTKDPRIANLLPAIESIRKDKVRGFVDGGSTSSGVASGGIGSSDPEVKELLRLLVFKMDNMPKRIKAYLVYSEFEKIQEEAEMIKKRYKA